MAGMIDDDDTADSAPANSFEFVVDEASVGKRLDSFLCDQFPELSRASLQRTIDAGQVTVDGRFRKASFRLVAGGRIEVGELNIPRPGPQPEEIALQILHEDADLIVVNKPAGMVVHPAKGHWAGTLASALAHHFGRLSTHGGEARPGIVHRLDRDTTGVIVVAKHDRAHEYLAEQFKKRTIEKEYLAIVAAVPDRDADVIDRPIGVHPTNREKMAIRPNDPASRDAVTVYHVAQRFARFAVVKAQPKTGRTHQIRVHLASTGYPVLCDRVYGGRAVVTRGELWPPNRLADLSAEQAGQIVLDRQALHAQRLAFDHPTTSRRMEFTAPLPEDIERALAALRAEL
jgi:23S rRNA pseudouridine1911/1915/1917 synthase